MRKLIAGFFVALFLFVFASVALADDDGHHHNHHHGYHHHYYGGRSYHPYHGGYGYYGYGGWEERLVDRGIGLVERGMDGWAMENISRDRRDVAMAQIHAGATRDARPGRANVSSSWGHMGTEYDGVGQSAGAGNQQYYDSQPEQQVRSSYSRGLEQLRQQAAEDYAAGEGIPYAVFDSMSPEARLAYGQTWDALEDARHETGVYYAKSKRRVPSRKPRSEKQQFPSEKVVSVEGACSAEAKQAEKDWWGFVEKEQNPPRQSPRKNRCYSQMWEQLMTNRQFEFVSTE